ncbi:hypothetical protein JTE90_027406 [Oedothorax gibbosus]|uniref:Uncharacterized protein n=1 Tax=Oedothorax gibbosus TaxID=931172 RepID=A0AAV6VZ78_9ARAC|nr:hypothetical protein JTE90_027406 [Oedothorax gibbosus]
MEKNINFLLFCLCSTQKKIQQSESTNIKQLRLIRTTGHLFADDFFGNRLLGREVLATLPLALEITRRLSRCLPLSLSKPFLTMAGDGIVSFHLLATDGSVHSQIHKFERIVSNPLLILR